MLVSAAPETKAPRTRGAPNSNRSAPQATTWGLTSRSLLKLAIGIARGFIASGLAHKVDVQEPVLQPRAFDRDMLGELVVTLESARGNAPVVRPR